MRRVLPFLFMVLFANALFAQTSQEKSAKYGTRPLADNPEPYLFINPAAESANKALPARVLLKAAEAARGLWNTFFQVLERLSSLKTMNTYPTTPVKTNKNRRSVFKIMRSIPIFLLGY